MATENMITAESLLIDFIQSPDLSSLCTKCPETERLKNQIHDANIHAKLYTHLSVPVKCKEFVPITPMLSIIACGFNIDTEAANKI